MLELLAPSKEKKKHLEGNNLEGKVIFILILLERKKKEKGNHWAFSLKLLSLSQN